MFTSLFPELKEMIFMYLPCKYIILLLSCCSNLNKFIKDNDIINKRKYRGFPRIKNHCKSHDISNLDTSSLVDFSWIYFNEIPSSETLNDILDLLLKLDIDLIRGDLISNGLDENKFNRNCDGLCVFDGSNIIPLYDEIDYQGLPEEFTVLNNNVNLYYWDDRYNRDGDLLSRGIPYDSLVWLDITEDIRSQLIDNISYDGCNYFEKYEQYGGDDIFYTEFSINNQHYYIITEAHEEFYPVLNEHFQKKYSDIFSEILISKSKIALRYNDTNELFGNTIENALFLDMHFNFSSRF